MPQANSSTGALDEGNEEIYLITGSLSWCCPQGWGRSVEFAPQPLTKFPEELLFVY